MNRVFVAFGMMLIFIYSAASYKLHGGDLITSKKLRTAVLLDTPATNMEISKNFVPRYFRDKGGRPLIDYISFNESEKAQLRLDNIYWKSDWNLKQATLQKGQQTREYSQGTVGITPDDKNKLIELLGVGEIVNSWQEKIKLSESENSTELAFEFLKLSNIQECPISIDLKLMRWVEEEELNIFIKDSKDGMAYNLKDAESRIFGAGSILTVAYWKTGNELMVSLDKEFTVKRTDCIKGVGGYIVRFQIENPIEGSPINMLVRNIRSKSFKYCGLDIFVNPINSAMHINAGGMPLLGIEAFDGVSKQSASGYTNGAWHIERSENAGGLHINSKGNIVTPWKMDVSVDASAMKLKWKHADNDRNPNGLELFIPYQLVGLPFKIKKTTGEIIDKSGNIPIRFGADLSLGEIRKGDRIIFRPTATEEVVMEATGNFKLESARKKLPSLDKGKCPSWYKHGIPYVIDLFPPAVLKMQNSDGDTFGVSLIYHRVFAKEKPSKALPEEIPENEIKYQYSKDKKNITIKSPYWEITHSADHGGAVSGISFFYGSNTNILAFPEEIYIETDSAIYKSRNNSLTDMNIEKHDKDSLSVIVQGTLQAKEKPDQSIPYRISYEYNYGYIKRSVEFDFGKGISGIKRIGMLKLNCIPEIDECQYRTVARKVVKAVFPGDPIVEKQFIRNGTFTLFTRGVEGIDFVYEKDIFKWDLAEQEKGYLGKGFLQYGSSNGYYAVSGNAAGGPSLIIEPFKNDKKLLSLSGKKSFGNYIGLPIIKRNLPPNPPMMVSDGEFYHPTEKELPFLKEMGINAIVQRGYLLNGNFVCTKFGLELPASPTKEEKNAFEDVRKKKKLYNSYGIKLIHYFATWAMDPMLNVYADHYKEWAVPDVNEKGELEFWPPGKKCSYVPVCLESPAYSTFSKKIIKDWMGCLGYDGIYFCVPSPYDICNNKSHYQGRHLIVDGVLDLCKWYKKEYPNTLFTGFSGYNSSIMLDNFMDANWIMEELQTWSSYEGRVPDLERMTEQGELIPNINRIIDRLLSAGWRKEIVDVDHKQYMSRAVLCRLFPVIAWNKCKLEEIPDILKYEFKLTRILKEINQAAYNRFADWQYQNAVITNASGVRAAVYWNNEEAIIVLSNSETSHSQKFNFRINKNFFNWKDDDRFSLKQLPEVKAKFFSGKELFEDGISDYLEDYDYKIFKLTKIKSN